MCRLKCVGDGASAMVHTGKSAKSLQVLSFLMISRGIFCQGIIRQYAFARLCRITYAKDRVFRRVTRKYLLLWKKSKKYFKRAIFITIFSPTSQDRFWKDIALLGVKHDFQFAFFKS